MFSLFDRPYSLCDRISRRELMRIGGLNLLGMALPSLLRADARAAPAAGDPTFGRAKNIIYLWLQGGPPQHETFDPKPLAPAEIRGPFQPIATNVPGIQFCELLPRTARVADKMAVVRSMATGDNIHSSSGYWVLTGNKHTSGSAREIKSSDWPYFGSIVKMLKPSERVPALTSVWVPDIIRLNENVTPAGQTAGFLGAQWDPDRFIGDPSSANYEIEGLALQDGISPLRLERRVSLFDHVGRHLDEAERSAAARDFDKIRQAAFGLLTSGAAREAFRIRDEPDSVRERYGKNRWGQCVLLARRLIEAGVRLVHVGWPREPGDSAVTNPMWDTHAQNADRLQDFLCPIFDVGYSALLEDLEQRGLLDETLVVAVAEFGRTPKINKDGGRDHWGNVFSFAMAGAGISGGQVHGSSDRTGGYPASDRVQPPDLTATMFHLLGIEHTATFHDRTGRPLPVTEGEPIRALLGSRPATTERTEPGGDLALVPPFDERQIRDVDFESGRPLEPHGTTQRFKSWQASPLVGSAGAAPWGVALIDDDANSRSGRRHVRLGWSLSGRDDPILLKPDTLLMLSQEVRNPMAGTYRFAVHAAGGGSSAEAYRKWFLKHFACRLTIFAFMDLKKNHTEHERFASTEFRPAWSASGKPNYERFEVSVTLRSQDGGAIQTNRGVGVAVLVEKKTPGKLALPSGSGAFVRIDDVEFRFDARQRNDDVVI
ncbi:MAG: DUF1501 domain-containing protein [Planctomycetota bacterium]|nr:MAG: DUF1501 domain-containing protein [Planctomycetota bacterium]